MEFYILDRNFNRVAVVDSYVSAIWCKRYYEIGGFDLVVEASEMNIAILQVGHYIVRSDDDMICRIEAIEIDTRDDKANTMLVGGIDCKKILTQRVIAETISHRGTLNDYIKRIVTENVVDPTLVGRRIDCVEFVSNGEIGDPIIQQVSYENVGETIISLCRSFLCGWRVWLDGGKLKVGLYKGRELPLVFSSDNENLYSSKYTFDETEYKNTALIGGEGEGENRTLVWFGNEAGLDRYELFVDDSSSSDGVEEIEYLSSLKSRGGEEVGKNGRKIVFEGEIDTNHNVYKQDFALGDVVRIRNEYGIESQARITEVMETWDEDGYTVEPKLEYLEFMPISPDVELESKLFCEIDQINQTTDDEIVLEAADHPYGVTIEIAGLSGGDGGNGYTDDYEEARGFTATWYSGSPGAGGSGGRQNSMVFTVDGESYRAIAKGGYGGGGGGGGFSNYASKGISFPAGKGGKGGSAGLVIINIQFTDKVVIKNVEPGSTLGSGSAGGARTYTDGSAGYDAVPPFPSGGASGDGNPGKKGTKGGGDGGSATSTWQSSSCSFSEHQIKEHRGASYCRVYTYINKNAIDYVAERAVATEAGVR